MNLPLNKLKIFSTYSQIRVHFRVAPPQACQKTQAALANLALLPGCVDYALTYWKQNVFQWSISGVWVSKADRDRHYLSDQIQVLFKTLIQLDASLIYCGEGQSGCPGPVNMYSGERLFLLGPVSLEVVEG